MNTIALCAIFKNEAPYLLEWVAFHRMIGVDHFVLYDNGSDDGGSDRLRRSRLADHVTLIDWPDRPGQYSAYSDFVAHHAKSYTWAGFIDLDEFIHPLAENSLRSLLDHPRYTGFSAVLMHWAVFGPSGHTRRPEDLVTASYTRRVQLHDEVNTHVKSIVRTADLLGVGQNPHVFQTSGPSCDATGKAVPTIPLQETACHETLILNHYFTWSREDWDAKTKRGRADAADDNEAAQYRAEVFATVAGNAGIEDSRITRFVPRLRWVMR